jgi:hypothetical protein
MQEDVVGNVITRAVLSAFEVGQHIGIRLIVMDAKTKKQFPLAAALEITE